MTVLLINRTPEPNEQNVPVGASVELEVTTTVIGDTIDVANTQVFIESVLAYDSGVFQPGWDGLGSSDTLLFGDTVLRIVIDPTGDLPSDTEINVDVQSQNVGGTETLTETYPFNTEDLTVPGFVGVRGIALNEIEVVFNEAIDPETGLDLSNYEILQLYGPTVDVAIESVRAGSDNTTFVLVTDRNITHDIQYELRVSDVSDPFGNVIPSGSSIVFDTFTPAVPATRRFELWWMLAQMNREEDKTDDLKKFIQALQEVVDQLLFDIDAWVDILDPDRAPEAIVDAMLADLGNPFTFQLTLVDKRRLLRVLVEIYRQKGTEKGIKNVARFFLGFEIEIEGFDDEEGMELGVSDLGINWTLGIGDVLLAYTFRIILDFNPTDEERKRLIRIVNYMKPAHTHLGEIVEPDQPELYDHWELGISELGENNLLH